MAIYLRILIFLLTGMVASAQMVTLPSLESLTNRTAIRGETVLVASGLSSNDWGGLRAIKHYTNNALFSTNVGNTWQAKGGTNGQWRALDATNAVQDLRWWLNGGSVSNALDRAQRYLTNAFGVGTISFPGTTLTTTNPLVKLSGINWRGLGSRISTVNGSGILPNTAATVTQAGSMSSALSLSSSVIAGTNTLVLSSGGSNFSVGDLVWLGNTNLFSYSPHRSYYQKGQFATVASVSSNTLRLNSVLKFPFESSYTEVRRVEPNVGDISGIGFVNPIMGQGVYLLLTAESNLDDVDSTGSDYFNYNWNTSIGLYAFRCFGEWQSDESLGLNYIAGVLGLQDSTIDSCNFTSSRHGLTFGNAAYPFVNNGVRVVNSRISGYSTTVPGLDLHGIAEDITIEDCEIKNGMTSGGNRITITGNRISNGNQLTAVAHIEQTGVAVTVRDNTFLLQRPGSGASVTAFRAYYDRGGGSGGGTAGDTNTWAGSVSGNSADRMVIQNNDVYQLSGSTPSGGTEYLFFIDSTLTTNGLSTVRFSGLDFVDNRVHVSGQDPDVPVSQIGLVVLPGNFLVFDEINIRNNDFGPYGVSVRPLGRLFRMEGNTIRGSADSGSAAVLYNASSTSVQTKGGETIFSGNRIEGAYGGGFMASGPVGRVTLKDNVFRDWGRGGTNVYAAWLTYPLNGDTNTVSANIARNVYEKRDSSQALRSLYVALPSATVTRTDETEIGLTGGLTLSTSAGVRTANGTNDFRWSVPGVTDALVVNSNQVVTAGPVGLGPKTTSELASLTNLASGAIAYNSTLRQAQILTNGAWVSLRNVNDVAFPSLTATNDITGSNLIGMTLSVGTGTLLANVPAPIFAYVTTNELAKVVVQNASTGANSGAGLQAAADGSMLRVMALGTNNSTGARKARGVLDATLGAGLDFDLPYPSSQDITFSYGGGTPFAVISTNAIAIRAPATGSAPVYLTGFLSDPYGTHRTLYNFPVASVLSGIGAQPLDADLTVIAAATGASNLVTSGDFALHYHTADRNRTNHIGTQAISTVINLQTELDNRQATNANLTTLATLNGSALTNLNGTEIRSGTVAAARIDTAMATDAEVAAGYQPLNSSLSAISGLTTNGILVRASSSSVAGRTITGDSEITVTNGDGISGNPTLAIGSAIARDAEVAAGYQPLDSDLTALAGISGSNGDLIVRSGGAWTRFAHPGTSGKALLSTNTTEFLWGDVAASGGGGTSTTNTLSKDLFALNARTHVFADNVAETNIVNQLAFGSTNIAAGTITTNTVYRVTASGTYSTSYASAVGNKWKVKLGALVFTYEIPESATLNVVYPTAPWSLVANVAVTATGASATVATSGHLLLFSDSSGLAASNYYPDMLPAAISGTLDTTVTNTVSLTYDNGATYPADVYCDSAVMTQIGASIVSGSGGSSGISGIRVIGASGSAVNGSTNVTFSVAPGTGLTITSSGTSPSVNLDVENTAPGFLVNGTGPTYQTDRWNLNSTTPSALTETVLSMPRVSGTNLSIAIPVAPTALVVSPTILSNSVSYSTIASGTLSSTNMPYVGAVLQGTIIGTFYNNTASGSANFFRTVVAGVTNLLSDPGGFGITSSTVTRSIVVEVLITRNSGVVNTAIGYQVGGSTAPTTGYSVLSSTPGLAPRWIVGVPASCDVSTNVSFRLDVANNVASTNFTTSFFGGGFK